MLSSFLIVLCLCFGAIAVDHRPCYAPICKVNTFCHHRLPACARNASLAKTTRSPWFEIIDDEIMGVPTEHIDVLLTNSQDVGIRGSCSFFILVRNDTEAVKMGKCHESISRSLQLLHDAHPPRIATLMKHWTSKHSLALLDQRISFMYSLGIGRIGLSRVPFRGSLKQEQTDRNTDHGGRPTADANSSEAKEEGQMHPGHSVPTLPKPEENHGPRVFHRDVTGGKFFRFELPDGSDGYRVAATSTGVWVTIDGKEVSGFTAVNGYARQRASFDLESDNGERLVFELRIAERFESWIFGPRKPEFNTEIKMMDNGLKRGQNRETALGMLRNFSKRCDMKILDATDTHVRWICSELDAEQMCATNRGIVLDALNSENVETNLNRGCRSPWRDRYLILGTIGVMLVILRICLIPFCNEAKVDAPPEYERFDLNDEKVASKHEDEPPKYEAVALEHTSMPQEDPAQIHQDHERFSAEIDEVARKDEQLV